MVDSSTYHLLYVFFLILFQVIGYSCDNLQSALKMYNGMLFMKATKLAVKRRRPKNPVVTVDGRLEVLNVHLTNVCEDYPSLDMDEKC